MWGLDFQDLPQNLGFCRPLSGGLFDCFLSGLLHGFLCSFGGSLCGHPINQKALSGHPPFLDGLSKPKRPFATTRPGLRRVNKVTVLGGYSTFLARRFPAATGWIDLSQRQTTITEQMINFLSDVLNQITVCIFHFGVGVGDDRLKFFRGKVFEVDGHGASQCGGVDSCTALSIFSPTPAPTPANAHPSYPRATQTPSAS